MKKLLLAAAVAALPSIAHAQNAYVEGAIGLSLLPDIQTDNYTFTTPSGVFAGNAETDYGADWAFGLEGGYQTGPWRFGVSWDIIHSEVNHARLEGTLNGAPFSAEVSDQQLADFGIGANNDINIFAANAYYVFNSFNLANLGFGIQPYIGIGLGAATINNASTEFDFLLTLGADVPLGQNFYLGGRYRVNFISGPTTDTNIKFGSITAHIISIVIGYRFPV